MFEIEPVMGWMLHLTGTLDDSFYTGMAYQEDTDGNFKCFLIYYGGGAQTLPWDFIGEGRFLLTNECHASLELYR